MIDFVVLTTKEFEQEYKDDKHMNIKEILTSFNKSTDGFCNVCSNVAGILIDRLAFAPMLNTIEEIMGEINRVTIHELIHYVINSRIYSEGDERLAYILEGRLFNINEVSI